MPRADATRIIALGTAVLPLILRDLPHRQSLWFWPLRHITGEDPVPEGQAGAAAVAACEKSRRNVSLVGRLT